MASFIRRIGVGLLSLLISIQVVSAISYDPIQQIDERYVVLKRCKGFEAQVKSANTVYEVRHSFNLKQQTIMLPPGCTLVFKGGSLKNGVLVGNNTIVDYDRPFLNKVCLKGTFETDAIPVDTEIFKDKCNNTDRIKSMLCIYGKNNKLVFSNNKFDNVETIELTRNVDIDFSNSTIKLKLDQGGLPTSFILTEEKKAESKSFLDFFKLKNARIIGNVDFEYDGTLRPKTSHYGKYRRCIQLFKVDEIEIDNVSFEHIETGTAGNFHQDIRERYELSIIAVMYYNQAKINGCELHDCSGDNLIHLTPNVTKNNMAIVSNCYSYRNYTGLIGITDGRCEVFGNKCVGFNSSAMNLFVYESDIHDNYFEDSKRSDCIDLSEDGTVAVHDVSIHNNTGVDIRVFCSICGDRINVYDNYSFSKDISPLVIVEGTREPNASMVNNNVALSSNRTARISNNTIKGGGIVSTVVNNSFNTSVRYVDTLYIEKNICEKESEVSKNYSHPVFLFNCKKALVRNNRLKGLSRNPAGKGSVAFICSYNVLAEDAHFNNDVEITGNELDYDAGLIGDNVLKSVYLQRNNREDKQSDVTLIIRDNNITGTEKGIRDVYLSSPIRNRKIKSERNKGFVRSSDY